MELSLQLEQHETAVAGCTACALAHTRGAVVVGGGPASAEVMIVGEAPGFQEERDRTPFAGAAGALLEELLANVGVTLADTYRTTLLKCRPPANRDPQPEELGACEPHLFRQVELVRPRVILTLGTLATRVLSGREHPITQVHGRAQPLTVGSVATTLLPLYHPAVALYTPAMQQTLAGDLACLPELLGVPCMLQDTRRSEPGTADTLAVGSATPGPEREHAQLGLF